MEIDNLEKIEKSVHASILKPTTSPGEGDRLLVDSSKRRSARNPFLENPESRLDARPGRDLRVSRTRNSGMDGGDDQFRHLGDHEFPRENTGVEPGRADVDEYGIVSA